MATTEDGIYVDTDYRHATCVDRTGRGGEIKLRSGLVLRGEVQHDHQMFPITREPFTLRGPVLLHAFTSGSTTWCIDAEGNRVNRIGVQSGPQDLLDQLGPDALDCSPIELDMDAVENWDYVAAGHGDRRETISSRVKRVKVPMPQDKEHGGGRVTAEKG